MRKCKCKIDLILLMWEGKYINKYDSINNWYNIENSLIEISYGRNHLKI